MALALFLASSLFFQAAFGEIICEDLPVELCSFSIASSGKRCLLDTNNAREGSSELQCCTTEIRVKNLSGLQRSMPVRAMSQLPGSGRDLARMISILAAGPVSNEKNSVAYPPTSV